MARKHTKKRLQANEQLFRSVFDNVQMAISLYRAANLLTNPSTSELGDGNRA
jgi:hypothetical protein